VSIIVEKNTPLTPLKRGIKKTPEIYPLDKEKNLFSFNPWEGKKSIIMKYPDK
jgi:hypothetical protein